MRKYLHTALIILATCLPCHAQFSAIWTNNDLFHVEQMASECYSAIVERCSVVGVTPDTPSWWDYIVGKNHAKVQSVKNSIHSALHSGPKFILPITNIQSVIESGGVDSLYFTNDDQFTDYCGVPRGFFTNTPYFKSQYQSESNGWHGVKRCLDQMRVVASYAFSDMVSATNAECNGYSTNSIAEAYSNALSAYLYIDNYVGDGSISSVTLFGGIGDYSIVIDKFVVCYSWYPYYGVISSKDSLSTAYAKVAAGNPLYGTTQIYDPQGDPVSTNYFKFGESTAPGGSPYPLIGNVVFPSSSYLTLPPNYALLNTDRDSQGWYSGGPDLATFDYCYDGLTNGFKYR